MMLGLKRSRVSRCAFSLLEVVLAMGVVSFALVGILAVFPVALNTARDSQDESRVTQLAQELLADLRARQGVQINPSTFTTNIYPLAAINIAYSRQGQIVLTGAADAYYKLNLEIVTDASLPSAIYQVNALYSWPYSAPLRMGSYVRVSSLVRP